MNRNTSITLGEHFNKFIAREVKKGHYGSASEVIRAGLRILEEREHKLTALRSALIAGEKSGFKDYSFEELFSDLEDES